jgi:hypothetical protein
MGLQILDSVLSYALGRWQCYLQAVASAFTGQTSSKCKGTIVSEQTVHCPSLRSSGRSNSSALQANTSPLPQPRLLKGNVVNLCC